MAGIKIITKNKRAYHDYEILSEFEAGIVLTGTEIKSIRDGKVSIQEAYCHVRNGEVIIVNMNISKYSLGTHYNHEETRNRVLLLHASEIRKLDDKVKTAGLTIVPLDVHLSKGMAKLNIALARGKKLYDKRQAMKEEELRKESR